MSRTVPLVPLVALSLPSLVVAQVSGPPLVVPVPPAAEVAVHADSFVASDGARRPFRLYRPAAPGTSRPVVVFANGGGFDTNQMRGYVDWAALVTSRGMAAVLYPGPAWDPARPAEDNVRGSVADLDSVVVRVARLGGRLGLDASRVVIWAGSAQSFTGTPFALTGDRPMVKGYVLYYGAGAASTPRLDVPVLVARAGLDSPGLNQALDSLTRELTGAGVPLTLINHPAGPHGFDVFDSSATSARVIAQTLDFMAAVTDPVLSASIAAGVPEARAAAAFTARRWADAERLYGALAQERPASRIVAWKLGLAQLENRNPRAALASFDRARRLGQGGARDIGLPAARAGVRAGDTARAVEWIRWALQSFPRIRPEIAADPELAPLLEPAERREARD